MPIPPQPSVGIGLGAGIDLCLSTNDTLYLKADNGAEGMQIFVPLSYGPVTKGRIDFIVECLNRLKIHAKD